jgi:RNA polymerase sigma-70 factor (ECF subfamily)
MTTSNSPIKVSKFLTLYQPIANKLHGYALRLTGNNMEAEDLVQETVFRAYKNLNSYHDGSNFKAWMNTIMRNMFINNYRKQKIREATGGVEKYAQEKGLYVFNEGYNNLRRDEFLGALGKLDEIYLRPLLMVGEGYQYEEMAKSLNIPVGTLKSRIHHGRKKLRKILKGWFY